MTDSIHFTKLRDLLAMSSEELIERHKTTKGEASSAAMWCGILVGALFVGVLVAFILSVLLIGPVLFLSVASWAKLACGGVIAACAIGTALTQLGYRRRHSLEQELKMRLVDVEQCSDARQEHYIRRALQSVRKANNHLGVES